jgi:hypothetical protein
MIFETISAVCERYLMAAPAASNWLVPFAGGRCVSAAASLAWRGPEVDVQRDNQQMQQNV